MRVRAMETKMMQWYRGRFRDENCIACFLWFLLCSPAMILLVPVVWLVKLFQRSRRKDQNYKKDDGEQEAEGEGKGREEPIEIRIEDDEEEQELVEEYLEEEEEEELMERYLEDQMSLIDVPVYYDSGEDLCVVMDVGRDDLQEKVTRDSVSSPLKTA